MIRSPRPLVAVVLFALWTAALPPLHVAHHGPDTGRCALCVVLSQGAAPPPPPLLVSSPADIDAVPEAATADPAAAPRPTRCPRAPPPPPA